MAPRHLCQCAWGVSTEQKNYLSALFRRLAARRGVKRATIGVAHALLGIAYHVLKRGRYRDLGPDYFDSLDPARLKRDSSSGSKDSVSTSPWRSVSSSVSSIFEYENV